MNIFSGVLETTRRVHSEVLSFASNVYQETCDFVGTATRNVIFIAKHHSDLTNCAGEYWHVFLPLAAGTVLLAAPQLFTLPLLSLIGFGSGGVAAGSIAAFVHSYLGSAVSGSLFATLQSAGAGGLGLLFVNVLSRIITLILLMLYNAKLLSRIDVQKAFSKLRQNLPAVSRVSTRTIQAGRSDEN